MFSKEQVSAYQSIRAPQNLHDKIMAAKKPKMHRGVIATGLVAACLVLVMGMSFLLPGGTPDIRINGQTLQSSVEFYDVAPAVEMRTEPMITVPVELELPRMATVTVSHGLLVKDSGVSAQQWKDSGEMSLLWQIPRQTELSDCELQIRMGTRTTVLTLEYEESKIRITKKGD